MVHNLSKKRLEYLEKAAKAAKPYTDEEFAALGFDGEDTADPAREKATYAKMILDQYYAEHGGKPEGEKDT